MPLAATSDQTAIAKIAVSKNALFVIIMTKTARFKTTLLGFKVAMQSAIELFAG